MTRANLLILLMVASLMLAPLAAAEENSTSESTNETPEDDGNAWVEDCPPDRMCAMESGEDNATRSEPSGDAEEPVEEGSTCMDGHREGEFCRDDVQYLDGGEPAPAGSEGEFEATPISAPAEDAGHEDAPSHEGSNGGALQDKFVSAPGFALLALGLMGLALVLAAPRSR